MAIRSKLQLECGLRPSTSTARELSQCSSVEFYSPENYQADESVFYILRRIVDALSAAIDKELEPCGLTRAQGIPLVELVTERASTVVELAKACETDVGSMTRTLDRLEAKLLIRRVRSGDDRRLVNIEPTERGRMLAQKVLAVLSTLNAGYLHNFTAHEKELLMGMLERVFANTTALKIQRGLTKNVGGALGFEDAR
jgi:DNA-binding MarR family transcriptional regulator